MKKKLFKYKKVLVIGIGKSGTSVCNLLVQKKIDVVATDDSSPFLINKLNKKVPFLNSSKIKDIKQYNCFIVSPGIPSTHFLIKEAERNKIPILSEIEIAFRFLPYKVPIIAVTGTNGKTTTVNLIKNILEKKYKRVFLAGNITTSFSEIVSYVTPSSIIVLELSSFQLERIFKFHPFISIILNISADHLERYSTFEEYINAKANIYRNQTKNDFVVLNYEDRFCRQLEEKIKGPNKIFFSNKRKLQKGVYSNKNKIYPKYFSISSFSVKPRIFGLHNWENILASVIVGFLFKIPSSLIKDIIENFRGLSHRLQIVGTYKERTFINDSKSTNIGSCKSALESFSSKVILLMGGRDKGHPYSSLKNLIKKKVKHIVAFGEARNKIKKDLYFFDNISLSSSLKEAVTKAFKISEKSDIILLSPACSSFDEFRNFEERGKAFCQYIKKL